MFKVDIFLMRILVIGAAGVVGSALTERFLKMGMTVSCLDICRIDEAWRLSDARDRVKYLWKASNDLLLDDVRGVDAIVDAGLGVADRPLGNTSPSYTVTANIYPPLRILDIVSRMDPGRMPTLIYPSSFNTLYGHPAGSTYSTEMLPNPSSVYGWTKAAVEMLCMTYHRAHGVPCIVTRVGSGYGARMRSDELPARLILNVLKGRSMLLRSPEAKRLWTYGEDIIDFYEKLVDDLKQYVGQTLHCAGNADNEIVTNMHLARLVARIGGRDDMEITPGPYEAGELVDGKPISFEIDGRSPLWNPRFTLEEGMTRTLGWFRENLPRYS